jgi:hypothetical protein
MEPNTLFIHFIFCKMIVSSALRAELQNLINSLIKIKDPIKIMGLNQMLIL